MTLHRIHIFKFGRWIPRTAFSTRAFAEDAAARIYGSKGIQWRVVEEQARSYELAVGEN